MLKQLKMHAVAAPQHLHSSKPYICLVILIIIIELVIAVLFITLLVIEIEPYTAQGPVMTFNFQKLNNRIEIYGIFLTTVKGGQHSGLIIETTNTALRLHVVLMTELSTENHSEPFNQTLASGIGINEVFVNSYFNYEANITGPERSTVNINVKRFGVTDGYEHIVCNDTFTLLDSYSSYHYMCSENVSGYYQVFYTVQEGVNGQVQAKIDYDALNVTSYSDLQQCVLVKGNCTIALNQDKTFRALAIIDPLLVPEGASVNLTIFVGKFRAFNKIYVTLIWLVSAVVVLVGFLIICIVCIKKFLLHIKRFSYTRIR